MYSKFTISGKRELQRIINGEKRQTFLECKLYFSIVINLMVNSQEIIEKIFVLLLRIDSLFDSFVRSQYRN